MRERVRKKNVKRDNGLTVEWKERVRDREKRERERERERERKRE